MRQMTGLNIRKVYKKNYHPIPRITSLIMTSTAKGLL